MKRKPLPIRQSILLILKSIIWVSGTAWGLVFAWKGLQAYIKGQQFLAKYVVQTGPQKEALPTALLVEVMELSSEPWIALPSINVELLEKKLLHCPVIESASVSKLAPNKLYVDYGLREPLAYLADVPGVALNDKGVLFATKPYLKQELLPTVYLGKFLDPYWELLRKEQWVEAGALGPLRLSVEVVEALKEMVEPSEILLVDVSKSEELAFGKAELVVCLQDTLPNTHAYALTPGAELAVVRYLRLDPKRWKEALRQYQLMRPSLWAHEGQIRREGKQLKNMTIDFRLESLAYLRYL